MKNHLIVLLSLCLLFNATYAQTETEKSALEKAKIAEDNQDYEEALKWFKKANSINPKNGSGLWCR